MAAAAAPARRAPRLRKRLVLGAIAAAIFAAGGGIAPLHAQAKMTIYRCTDPAGNVTLQNDVPCPKGHAQQIRDVTALPAPNLPPPAATKPAAPAAAPAAPKTPPAAAPAALPVAGPPQPPPALYQCRSWDDRDYLGETAEPPASCAPLQTVGIDGSPELGAGTACEIRRDTCTAIPAEQLCRAWKRRVDEAEFRWKFAGSGNDERKAEYERFLAIYRGSTCAR